VDTSNLPSSLPLACSSRIFISLLAIAFLRCSFLFMPLEIRFEKQFESFYDNLQNVKDESAKRLAKG
jgi:hypothetical protein